MTVTNITCEPQYIAGIIIVFYTNHSDCLRYCFMDLIQKELDSVAHEWHVHRIRHSSENPVGLPNMLLDSVMWLHTS